MASLTDTLKQYFEIAIETDDALKAAYSKDKLKDCAKYITDKAREHASSNCAMVESDVVFKWARDFFYGDTEDGESVEVKGAEARIKKEVELEAKKATVIREKKPKTQTKAEANGWELFQGSLFDDLPPEDQGGAKCE